MPVILQTVTSTVSALWGRSYIRDANGKFRLLKMDEVVVRGDMILTEQNAIVQLTEDLKADASPAASRVAHVKPRALDDVDRTIAGLEKGDINFLPAAGTSAGDGGLTPATVVERLQEAAPAGLPAVQIPVVLPSFNPGSAPAANASSVTLGPPVGARLNVSLLGESEVTEGNALVFPVQLGDAATEPVTLPFTLAFDTAIDKDVGRPLFSAGVVLNAGGTVTIPAGVAAFVITVPTIDDQLIENPETVTVTLDGVSATGRINDNDQPSITAVEPGLPGASGDAVVEGDALIYTVSLSQPTATASLFAFSLGGSAASGASDLASGEDHGAPVFTEGVVLNADGTLTVPAGVSSFTITVPTLDDTLVEALERLPLTVAGVSGIGTIVDNDGGAPTIDNIQPGPPGVLDDTAPEGAPLSYTVTLSGSTTAPTSYPYALGGGTAGPEDFGTPVFTGGVTLNPDGTITVPAGIIAFTITVPTSQDTLPEANETVPVTVGGVSATATIIDDDQVKPAVVTVEPGTPGLLDDATPEGRPLVYTVTLSAATSAPADYDFALGGGSAFADDVGEPVFSAGVILNAEGTITVPAGVASFTVTVPTTQDTQVEANETVPLAIDGVAAIGTIIDDDGGRPVVVTVEPGNPGIGDDRTPEGNDLLYTVTLSGPARTPANYAFAFGAGSAAASDLGLPAFSNGVTLNADGTVTVPAGISDFTITLPTAQDVLVEGDETVPLSVGGVAAVGTIIDDDRGAPTVVSVEPGSPGVADDRTPEGQALSYTVTLSAPTTAPVNYPFSVGGGTAGPDDSGAPAFSDGVMLNADGTITVPAGVARFTVTVPTTQDTLVEADETLPLSVDGVAALGTIVDDDRPPTITTVEPGAPGPAGNSTPEGADLVYTVSLSAPTTAPVSYPFTLGGGSAGALDFASPEFSDGVLLNADGTITVPAGVSAFTVTVPTTQDPLVENDETVPLTIGGVAASGTIVDDDAGKPTVTRVEPGAPGLADNATPEGSNLVYTVSLSASSNAPATYAFTLGGGTAGSADIGVPVFSDGVTLNADGTITVPAGLASFTITVPTTQDSLVEANETVPLAVGGVSGIGSIIDDDAGKPTVTTVEPGNPGLADDATPEGSALVYAVTLSAATTTPATYAFTLGGGSAEAGDTSAPLFSDGVVLNADGTLTVPAGVAGFTVTVPTVQDTLVEADETVPLSIGGVAATGSIVDDDGGKPSVITVEPGTPGLADNSTPEGAALIYTVTLSAVTTSPARYDFNLGGGSAGASDIGAPVFSNGVTLAADGRLTVPAGVGSFTVTVPTVQDTLVEVDETLPLSVGGTTATGTIVDDDSDQPTITTIEPGAPGPSDDKVTEGGTLGYTVTLSSPTTAPVTYPFAVGGGTAVPGDFGTPTFTNGVTLNFDGSITVPAGVDSFTVNVPTTQDTLVEADETLPLSIGGVSSTGTIVDDDAGTPGTPPTVVSVEPGSPGTGDDRTPEGNSLVFSVSLSGTTTAPLTLSFALGGGTASGADLGAPTFTNGVSRNADGTLNVPAGIASFSVTVPSTQDSLDEPDETVPLRVGGVAGTGTIVDDDGPPTITRIEPGSPGAGDDTVLEGASLVYTVSLSNPSSTAVSFSFSLGGGTAAAADIGSPLFSHGVTLGSNGTLSVPAGVTEFTVTVPTVQDSTDEPDETLPLRIGGVSATGTIVDDDLAPPTITGVEPGQPGAGDDRVPEGTALVYTVTMSGPSATPISYPFVLAGGSASAADVGAPVFSNGVVLNADGTITVPAGVTRFSVTVPTTQDSLQEGDETVRLNLGGVVGIGTIVDDDFNRAPVVGSVSASVSEEGLAGGNADDSGNATDTTNASSASGHIVITDPDGEAVSGVVLTAPTAALTSGGNALVWSGSGTPMLTASAGGQTVATATIDDSGRYTVTLLRPLDHAAGQGENVQRIDFGVSASDGQATGRGTLTINVEDDAPVAVNTTSVVTLANIATNVMVVLDISGSMKEPSGIDGLTRLQAAVQSIKTLLDRYDAQGDVAVRLVTFAASGQPLGASWTTVDQAKALLAKVTASSGTNYDDALADAITAFGSPGRITGGNNVSYFLSDGEPNTGSGSSSTLSGSNHTSSSDAGIQAAEARLWTDFLDAQGVQSHALAMGTGTTPAALAPIAYNGQTHTAGAPLLVDSFSDLPTVLLGTTALSTSGRLFASTSDASSTGGSSLGADGGHVHSFSVDGVSYSYDPRAQAGAGQIVSSAAHAYAYDASTKTLTVDTAGGGRFVVDLDDGGYTYRASASVTTGFTERFSYALIDRDGDVAAATGQVQISGPSSPPAPPPPPPANQAPVIGAASVTVSEEGLAGGLADSVGSQGDRTNLSSASGRVSINDPEGQAISSVVLTAPTTALTSGGHAVTWAGSGSQTLTASAGGQLVATACIDNQGNYCFKLLRPLDHANGNGENVKTLDIGIAASDGKSTGTGHLTVNVEDDAPQVGNASSSLQGAHTNVMVVLDISGSMADPASGLGMSKLQAAVKSIESLLDRYDSQGDVAVRLVGFSSEGKTLGSCWTSVAQAKTLLATLKACGSTNYDDALADAIAAFGSAGKIAGAQNVSYFLSDGCPTAASGSTSTLSGSSSGSGDYGIQAAEEKAWTDFLGSNRINSYALGMGGNTSLGALSPVAYDGRSQTNTAATVVDNFSDLDNVLSSTSAGSACGKLFAATATAGAGQLGADGGHVHSFSVDGITYRYDPAGNGGSGQVSASSPHAHSFDVQTQTLAVSTTAGGQYFVDMDGGGYSYRAPLSAVAGFAERFNFTLADRDGDLAGGTGTVSVGAVPAPISGAQQLNGSAGADHLQGGAGNDVLDGGAGNDHLFGGFGSDVFKWDLADRGTPGAPTIDTVHDFDMAPTAAGGDRLDLRDLLGGALQAGGADKLAQYLDIDTQSQPGSTVLHISTQGGFAQGQFAPQAEDQRIVLDGVNLHDALSLGAGASEDQILQELIHRSKIETGL